MTIYLQLTEQDHSFNNNNYFNTSKASLRKIKERKRQQLVNRSLPVHTLFSQLLYQQILVGLQIDIDTSLIPKQLPWITEAFLCLSSASTQYQPSHKSRCLRKQGSQQTSFNNPFLGWLQKKPQIRFLTSHNHALHTELLESF